MNRVQIYNQAINTFWTALCFIPVLRYWIPAYQAWMFFPSLSLSLIPFFIPTEYFRFLQISRNRKLYERLGIKRIQAVTQNGLLIQKFIRKTQPEFRHIKTSKDLRKLRSEIEVYDKYHLACFIFFLISLCLAIKQGTYANSIYISLSNIIYNIFPILIQQYNKARLGMYK